MAYYAEAAVSSHESTGSVCASVCVFMSQHVYFGVCPPFTDSFVCMRVNNHGKTCACMFACAFQCCQRTSALSLVPPVEPKDRW